ncbi:MAG: DUF47 family protein [Candidatus Thorarchaeota archaeon]|nr:DUF47 family protein [Candidatus Thorarchaeota archaeon]
MSDDVLTREEVLTHLIRTLEIHESIGEFIGNRLCEQCDNEEEDWIERRQKINAQMKKLLGKYDFARRLPRNELGVSILAIVSYIIKIQHSFRQTLFMIDMVGGEAFGEVFKDSMNSITSKTGKLLTALKNLVHEQIDNPEGALEKLDEIVRLEREIDEDNMVICRQISVATEGEAGYTCYIMRKIVSVLEHISDFVKEAAEIIVDI